MTRHPSRCTVFIRTYNKLSSPSHIVHSPLLQILVTYPEESTYDVADGILQLFEGVRHGNCAVDGNYNLHDSVIDIAVAGCKQ